MTAVEPDIETRSRAERLADAGLLREFVEQLSDSEADELAFKWEFWQRPSQVPPDGWRQWMIRAGRGYGKTRTGAETIRDLVTVQKTHGRVAIIAPTAGDARDVMVEGESGLLDCHPASTRPIYEPSKRRLTWRNGAIGTVYSGEKPDRLRGPQHDLAWIDEPASMPLGEETLNNARFGLRLGNPKLIVTGTPKPRAWLRAFMDEHSTHVTSGSTYDNIHNLAPEFIELMLGRYEGTRLGLQELYGMFLDDVEGALWTQEIIEGSRITVWSPDDPWRSLRNWLWEAGLAASSWQPNRPWRTIIAVDPPGETAECGIIAAMGPKRGSAGRDHCAIMADHSLRGRPERWGAAAVSAYHAHNAEAIYVESNQGGDMVRATIHAVDPEVPVRKIHAKESKQARAEPIAALYERQFVHHVGFMPQLEEQLTTWVPNESKSPDRLDALVHAVRELLPAKVVAVSKLGSKTILGSRI